MYKASAVIIGAIITIMVTINGVLAVQAGDYLSVLIINLVGLATVMAILIAGRKKIKFSGRIPAYLFSAGAIGVIMVIFNNMCVNNLGVSLTLSLGLLGQSIASGVIDHFGLFGMDIYEFNKEKLIGFAAIFAGIAVMIIY